MIRDRPLGNVILGISLASNGFQQFLLSRSLCQRADVVMVCESSVQLEGWVGSREDLGAGSRWHALPLTAHASSVRQNT